MKKILYVLVALLFVSCASVHPGSYGRVVDSNGVVTKDKGETLVVSGDTDKSLSGDYYKFMVFTFENKGGETLKISNPRIKFEEKKYNDEIYIVSDKELSEWLVAQQNEKKRREQNRTTALGGAAIVGGLLSFADGTVGDIGNVLFVGGAAGLGTDALITNKKDNERGTTNNNTNLMSGNFDVLSGLYTRRWIALKVKDKKDLPKRLLLTYDVNGIEETREMTIKW